MTVTTRNSLRKSFNSCANRAAFQLQATDRPLSRASRHNNLNGLVTVPLLPVLNVKKTKQTNNRNITADAVSTEEPDDQAAIPPPNNITGEVPLNEAQHPITVDQRPRDNARAGTSLCIRKKKFFLLLIAGRLSLSPGNRKNFFAAA